jgi:glycine dehydrogenase subunit 2
MIEPTETESKQTLDQFCDAMIQIAREAESAPDGVHEAPVTTPVRRLDQTKAAREPDLKWTSRGVGIGDGDRVRAQNDAMR